MIRCRSLWIRRRRKRENEGDADVFLNQVFNSVIPDQKGRERSSRLITKVQDAIKLKFKSAQVFVYGSHASKAISISASSL